MQCSHNAFAARNYLCRSEFTAAWKRSCDFFCISFFVELRFPHQFCYRITDGEHGSYFHISECCNSKQCRCLIQLMRRNTIPRICSPNQYYQCISSHKPFMPICYKYDEVKMYEFLKGLAFWTPEYARWRTLRRREFRGGKSRLRVWLSMKTGICHPIPICKL